MKFGQQETPGFLKKPGVFSLQSLYFARMKRRKCGNTPRVNVEYSLTTSPWVKQGEGLWPILTVERLRIKAGSFV